MAEENEDYDAIITKLNEHFNPKRSAHLNRFKFRNIEQFTEENFDEFANRVSIAAKGCNFGNGEDNEIAAQIIQRCKSEGLKVKALNSADDLTIKQVLAMGRLDESIRHQVKSMTTKKETFSIERPLDQQRPSNQNQQQNQFNQHQPRQPTNKQNGEKCRNCGYDKHHQTTNEICPAKTKQCKNCGKQNHFARMCRSTRSNFNINQSSDESTDDETNSRKNYWQSNIVKTVNSVKKLINHVFMPTVIILLCQSNISFSIDTGSQVDIIDEKHFRKLKLPPKTYKSHTRLYGYNSKDPIPLIGEFKTRIFANNCYHTVIFVVTSGNGGNLLSYETAVKLGILKRINTIDNNSELQKWKTKYPDAFRAQIGLYKNFKVDLHIDKSITPKQDKLRHVPFHLREKVSRAILKMLDEDLIEAVPGPTPWISAIVPVPKRNEEGDVRICSDARKANKAIKRQRHIQPTSEDLFVKLNGAKYISKIDLKAGYNQIMISNESRYITAFCTPLGIFQYKRLNFGINTSAELFQKAIEGLIHGIIGALNFSDDIIVFGKTKEEHDVQLDQVLKRINDGGLTVNEKKCEFGVKEIDFFGLHFSSEGISTQESKVNALMNAKSPNNPSELRSLLGLANYSMRFIENLASIVQPLRHLTKSGVKWDWKPEHETALNKLKNALSTKAMSYFDPELRTEITVDASPVGLGVVFAQYDQKNPIDTRRIIQYGSRTLSDVETRYSQVEKEALVVVWACEKLHLYLYGCEFDIITDNKAVELIFGNAKSQPKARIERWCLRLLPYNFVVKHRPGISNIADYLSRNPMSLRELHDHEDIAERYINQICSFALPDAIKRDEFVKASSEDMVLQSVRQWLNGSRPGNIGHYNSIRNELSVTTDGLVLRGNRLCVPQVLQAQIIKLAHQGHQGMVRTKQLIRSYVWFPGIDDDVEKTINNCQECRTNTDKFQLQPLNMSPMPNGPWEELSIDIFGPMKNGKHLLVLVDDFSRYPVVKTIHSTAAQYVIPHLNEIFAMLGIPKRIRSDGGPPFNGYHWKQFAKSQGFQHHRITPYWPRANGLVERFMKNLAKVLKNASIGNKNFENELIIFLRNYRATPHASTKRSPNELLLKTKSSTSKLPVFFGVPTNCDARVNDELAKHKMKHNTDSRLKAKHSNLEIGNMVLLRRPMGLKDSTTYDQEPFIITQINGNQATITRGNQTLKRNFSQLKKIECEPSVDFNKPSSERQNITVSLEQSQETYPEETDTEEIDTEETELGFLKEIFDDMDPIDSSDDEQLTSDGKETAYGTTEITPRRSNRTTHKPDRFGYETIYS